MANSLNDLLVESPELELYFLSLPGDVQDAVSMRAEEICTVDDLEQYVALVTGETGDFPLSGI
jgi:hypothetical protein